MTAQMATMLSSGWRIMAISHQKDLWEHFGNKKTTGNRQ